MEQLREQAERARAALTATALEIAELSKSNLSHLVESGPDPIKDIAKTALQAHYVEKSSKGAKIHDFCLGIPYGGLLVLGGLLRIIISGTGEAIRFGVLLGSILLALLLVLGGLLWIIISSSGEAIRFGVLLGSILLALLLVIGGLLWIIISSSGEAIRFGVLLGSILFALSVASLKVWEAGKKCRVESVKDQHLLSFMWPLPCLEAAYLKKPQDYISHLIGHEEAGSLLSLLKEKGWAEQAIEEQLCAMDIWEYEGISVQDSNYAGWSVIANAGFE